MSPVFVVRAKNINVAAELYKKINKEIIKIVVNRKTETLTFLDLNIWSRLFPGSFNELKSSKLSINPLFLPILKNLFFRFSKIS